MAIAIPETLEKISLHGLNVHRVTMETTLETIERFTRESGTHHVVTLDASMCVLARDDEDLKRIVRNAELVTPDSVGVLWACQRGGTTLSGRVSGVEIIEKLCARSPESGLRLFFFGAAPGVADAAAARMNSLYPGCHIVGTHSGFFSPSEEAALLAQIREARPDVLCVALGIPKQEKWIARHRETLGVPVLIGVGGTFDVLSGQVQRAPVWIQRLNLEWLHRLCKNPKKIGKVMTLPKFVLMTLRARKS